MHDRTMSAPVRAGVAAVLLCGFVGCGSSDAPASNDGPPVPDPGGPFKASIASSLRIDTLTLAESDTLCRDIADAYYGFLAGAITTANVCGATAVTTTSETSGLSDGGLDAGGVCSTVYAECARMEPPAGPFFCPIPSPGHVPQPCDATVGDLSACLNELAASDPVAACRTSPTCDAGAQTDVDAQPHPAAPACDRVRRICLALGGFVTFPC